MPPRASRRGADEGPAAGGAGGNPGGGGGGGGRGQPWATGGLSFDTTGIKEFTTAMKAAAAEVERFWKPFAQTREASRQTAKFFDDLEKRVKKLGAEAKKQGISSLTLGGGGGGGGGSSGIGGDSKFSGTPARQVRRGFQRGASGAYGEARTSGQPFFSSVMAGMSAGMAGAQQAGSNIGVGAAASTLLGSAERYAANTLNPAQAMQTAATRAALVQGGTWSKAYRDRVQETMQTALGRFGATRVQTAQAATTLSGAGLATTGAGGQGLSPYMQSAGAMGLMTGTDIGTQAQVGAGLRSPNTVNMARMMFGINTQPGGKAIPQMQLYAMIRDRIFAPQRGKPTKDDVRNTIMTPGTKAWLQVQTMFGGDAQAIDSFQQWVLNSAGGADITAANVNQSAGGSTTAAVRARAAGTVEETKAAADEAALRGSETAAKAASGLANALNSLIGPGGPLHAFADVLGETAGAVGSFRSALGMGGGGGGGGGGGVVGAVTSYAAGKTIVSGATKAATRILGRGAGAEAGGLSTGTLSNAGGVLVAAGAGLTAFERNKAAGRDTTSSILRAAPSVALPGLEAMRAMAGPNMADKFSGGKVWVRDKAGKRKQVTLPGLLDMPGQPKMSDADKQQYYQQWLAEKGYTLDGTGDPVGAWGWRMPRVGGIGDPTASGAQLRGPGQSQGMNSDFLTKLGQMFTDNPKLSLTSGFRSRAEQERLYREKPGLAAPPGKSLHEKGLAADIGPSSEYGWLSQNAGKYGLTIPMPGKEPWHVQPSGGTAGAAVSSSTAVGGGAEMEAAPSAGVGGSSMSGPVFNILGNNNPLSGGATGGGGGAVMRAAAGGVGKAAAAAAGGGGGGGGGNQTQQDIMRTILQVGQAMGADPQMLLAAFETAWVESNMTNVKGGDRDSQGVFQQRPSQGWGTVEQVTDVAHAATSFFQRAAGSKYRGKGSAGQMAQDVQRSAYPARYDQKRGQAASSLAGLGIDVSGIGDPVSGVVPTGAAFSGGGGGAGVTIQQATFVAQIARGTPEEAERFAKWAMDIMTDRTRLLSVGGAYGS